MKKEFFLIVWVLVYSLNATNLKLNTKSATLNTQHSLSGIQLFTLSKKLSKEEIYKRVAKKTDLNFYLRETEKYFIGYYGLGFPKNALKKKLAFVRKYFPSAFIIHVLWYHPERGEVSSKRQKISKYEISKIIVKSNTLYCKGDELGVIMQYESLIDSDVKNPKIINNLCYLYGKYGMWDKAKKIINNPYQPNLLYAYAYGSVETLQPNVYNNLQNYIILDKSGHLQLLTGYYFEQKGDEKKAGEFYKMAYEKNRNDIYNMYAYARYLDIIGQKIQAINLYKNVYNKTDETNELHKALQSKLYR